MSNYLDHGIESRLIAIFKDQMLYLKWLSLPLKALNGLSPLQILESENKDKLIEIITKIEHGDFS
ncbi:DUF2384 domain-containing protein [Photobacterium phosphoreum]|nr:hypothetical protein AYY24_20135 [Photobacterium phosphoreum]PSW32579.1 DUF2384 domain-containing protein [Photobacterium phosphoreum]